MVINKRLRENEWFIFEVNVRYKLYTFLDSSHRDTSIWGIKISLSFRSNDNVYPVNILLLESWIRDRIELQGTVYLLLSLIGNRIFWYLEDNLQFRTMFVTRSLEQIFLILTMTFKRKFGESNMIHKFDNVSFSIHHWAL